jgi:formate hydrogenlyase subunit 4
MTIGSILGVLAAFVLAPLLLGVINRTKAVFAGRRGQPLLQTYFDLAKLLRKGAVYSRTTSWVFRLGPVVGVSVTALVACAVPMGGGPAVLSFQGDLILVAYLLALMRFFTVAAALDTGSAFEGMGASREVQFSALAEPALLIGLATLARASHAFSLTEIFARMDGAMWGQAGHALVLVGVAFVVVLLVENSRIPFDDPNTHLELTMVHEVMVLDHGGPDLGLILYAAALKLWVLGALVVNLVTGALGLSGGVGVLAFVAGMGVLAVLVGVIESCMARLSLLKVPRVLVGATAVSILAFALVMRAMP